MITHRSGACLGDETIAAMLEGGLADEPARIARAHIGSCDECRRLVSAAIDGDPDPPTVDSAPGWATASAPASFGTGLAPGAAIAGRYLIERAIGDGGMGRVFAARQLGLERPVAIKILRPSLARDPNALARFQREARLVAALGSEHVVRVHDLGTLETGEPFLVMELVDGEDLATVIARGPVPVEYAVPWVLAACDAIGEAHALGIVHRDLKPSNLMVTRQGRIKVLDFGLAKLALRRTGSLTNPGMVLGSPQYMAPEQITGARDVDLRADVWSLGATLYHLIAGAPPFAAPTIEAVLARILTGSPVPLASASPGLAAVIAKALTRDPAARFATIGDFAAALVATQARPRPARRGWIFAGVGGAVGAGMIVAIASSSSSTEPTAAVDGSASPIGRATVPPPRAAPPPFAFTTPARWRLADDAQRARSGATADMIMLVPDQPSQGKARAILIVTEIGDLDATELAGLSAGSADYCSELGVESAAEASATLVSAKPTKLGGWTGCEVELVKSRVVQRMRSLANGKIAVMILCSRDKTGDPPVDAACSALASTVVAK